MLCLAQISCSKMGESEIPSSGGADEVPPSEIVAPLYLF
jgi:hypothetical protein